MIYVYAWLLIGFITVTYLIVEHLRLGKDLTIDEIWAALKIFSLGPIGLLLTIGIWVDENKNKVIIKGRKKREQTNR